MTQFYTIHWQSPHGKQITSRALTETQARAEIENNQRHTPNWMYTVEPPLPDLQAMLDAANARIAELESPESRLRYGYLQQYEQMLEVKEQRIAALEAVCREVIDNFMISYVNRVKSGIRIQTNWGGYYAKDNDEDKHEYELLSRLLDILPPAE